MSVLTAFDFIQERSQGTPGLWNRAFSQLSDNIRSASEGPFSISSGQTVSLSTNVEVIGGGHFQFLSVGSTPPSALTTAAITVRVNSNQSDYLYLTDSGAARFRHRFTGGWDSGWPEHLGRLGRDTDRVVLEAECPVLPECGGTSLRYRRQFDTDAQRGDLRNWFRFYGITYSGGH